MKAIFFLLVLFLSVSVFALSPYTMPGQKPDLNTGKYGKGQAVTPLAYSASPEVQPLYSINSVFPSLNNIDFATDGNLSIEMDYATSKITLKVLPIAFSKADVNNAEYFGGQLPGFYLDYLNLTNTPDLSGYAPLLNPVFTATDFKIKPESLDGQTDLYFYNTNDIDYFVITTNLGDQTLTITGNQATPRFIVDLDTNFNSNVEFDGILFGNGSGLTSIKQSSIIDANNEAWLAWAAITGVPAFNEDTNADINKMIKEIVDANFIPYQGAAKDVNLQQKNILAKDVNLYRAGKITFHDNQDVNKFSLSDFNYGKTESSIAGDLIDSSTNTTNVAMAGTVQAQAGKIAGGRGVFSTSNYFIDNSLGSVMQVGQSITITAWVYTVNKTFSGNQRVLSSTNYGGSQVSIGFADSSNIAMRIGKYGAGDNQATKAVTLTDGQWHWICGTYNGADNKINVYWDNDIGTEATYGFGAAAAGNLLRIGSEADGAPAMANFYIDDLRIYQSVLSESERNAIYNSGNGTESVAGTAYRWFKMNEGSSTVLPSIMAGLQTDGIFKADSLLLGSAVPNNTSSGDLNISGKSYFSDDANFFKNVKIGGTLIGGSPVKIQGGLNVLSGSIQAKEIKSSVIYSTDSIYYKTLSPKPLCIMADNNAVVGCLPEFNNGVYSFVCIVRPECDNKTKELELLDKEWATVKSKYKDDKNKE